MTTSAKVIADSTNKLNAFRLTTFEVVFPRFILAEFNTHRVFSRNSASSRAIPVKRQLELIEDNPFVPQAFPINQAGMSATNYITKADRLYGTAATIWLRARDAAVIETKNLLDLGIHKQIANRLLEPFMYHLAVVSSTDYSNFYDLRISPHAQPEINELAELMLAAHEASTPAVLGNDEWHTPYLNDEEKGLSPYDKVVSSTARSAATSYMRQNQVDRAKEIIRFGDLASNKHLSPFEHPAKPSNNIHEWANFKGWVQARHYIERGKDLPA